MVAKKQDLETRIFELVKKEPFITTMRITSKLCSEDPGVPESMVDQAIWRLVDRGTLAWTDGHEGWYIAIENKE